MTGFDPSKLHSILRGYFAGNLLDGLFTASLDHSPTEQLVGATWHTSALILSEAVQHAALANDLGKIANPLSGKLTKWSRANSHYRKRFRTNFIPQLSHHRVLVFAVSAMEATIASCEAQFVAQLGCTDRYKRHIVGGRERVSIGPFVNGTTGEEHTVELSVNQAPMVLFVVHFLRRMHQEMHIALSVDAPTHVTWNFLADKPPNGAGGPYDRAMAMLLGLVGLGGSLRWGYFLEGDSVETDLLADNVAGLLNEVVRAPQRHPDPLGRSDGNAGFFYWEPWEGVATAAPPPS